MFLILGPVLNLVAGFFWQDGRQGATAGTLIALSTGCWVIGLFGVHQRLRPRAPRLVAATVVLTVFGAVGAVAFAVQAIHEEIFHISHAEAVDRLNEYPIAADLYWLCGPLFPLCLAALGLILWRLRAAPLPVYALLIVGSAAFPVSRITRQASIAHVADLLLLIPFLYLGVQQLRASRTAPAPLPTSTDGARL